MSYVKQASRQDLPKATSVSEEVTDKQTWPAHLVTVRSSRNSFLNILYCIRQMNEMLYLDDMKYRFHFALLYLIHQ